MQSETLNGPDGRTSSVGKGIAKRVRDALRFIYPTTDLRQYGYGPSSFDVDLGENLIATVTVEVKRVTGRSE